jgi:hypothetical protein
MEAEPELELMLAFGLMTALTTAGCMMAELGARKLGARKLGARKLGRGSL